MNPSDAYRILGIPANADDETIRRSYKKLALRYHPDKNSGNSEKFKEINEAYQCLTKTPDNGLDDLLGQLFRDMGLRKPRGPTIHVTLDLTLEQLYSGGTHRIRYQRKEPTGEVKQVMVVNQMGPITIHEVRMVPEFRTVDHEYDFVLEKSQETSVPIVIDMEEYLLSIQLVELPHPTYTRVGCDLHTTLTISLREALLGFQRNLVGLSGTLIEVICKNIVGPTTTKSLGGEGYTAEGRLFVKFNIEFPKELSNATKEAIGTLDLGVLGT